MKRDLAWIELSEDVRSTILRGILDSEIIPNELLGTPATLEENKKEDENEIEEEDRQLVVEENSDEEADVEPQQVISRNQVYGSLWKLYQCEQSWDSWYHQKIQELPPNVAKEPEKVDDQIDIPIAPKDSNDSKEGKNYLSLTPYIF